MDRSVLKEQGGDAVGMFSRRSLVSKAAVAAVGVPAAAGALASIGAAAPRQTKRFKVTFVGSLQGFPFWNQIEQGAVDAGRDFDTSIAFKFTAPTTFTGYAQIEQFLQAAVSGRPDGIAVDYRGKTYWKVLKKALDAGIAVQFYNNAPFPDEEKGIDPRIGILLCRPALWTRLPSVAAR